MNEVYIRKVSLIMIDKLIRFVNLSIFFSTVMLIAVDKSFAETTVQKKVDNIRLEKFAKDTTVEILSIEDALVQSYPYKPGSGVIIDRIESENKFILTNHHIYKKICPDYFIEDTCMITFISIRDEPGLGIDLSQSTIQKSSLIEKSVEQDIVLLKPVQRSELIGVKIDNSISLTQGEQVYVAGFPGGKPDAKFLFVPMNVISFIPVSNGRGKLFNRHVYAPSNDGKNALNGMSGGSILNSSGNLVGIYSGQLPDSSEQVRGNLRQGIPSSAICDVLIRSIGSECKSITNNDKRMTGIIDTSEIPILGPILQPGKVAIPALW